VNDEVPLYKFSGFMPIEKQRCFFLEIFMAAKIPISSPFSDLDSIHQILDKDPALKQRVLYRIRELKRAMGDRKKTYSLQEQKEIRLQYQQQELEKKKT
jgi:hypothetical protein